MARPLVITQDVGSSTPLIVPPAGTSVLSLSFNLWGAKGSFDLDHTTRDLSKLETLARLMTTNDIDVYLLQETWLFGDWTKTIANVTIIHHGPAEAVCNPGSGGVAIMLGPRV